MPLHTEPQTVIQARESRENIPQTRRVRDVSERIGYLDPDAAPFTLVTSRASTKSCFDPKFEWMEKDLPAKWTQINAGLLGTGDTVLTVDKAGYFVPGDVVNNPRTTERYRVTAVGATTITVVRAVGTTVATALLDNDDLQIIGNAYTEGSPKGTPHSWIESVLFNYTQIFRHLFGVTETEQQSRSYTGDDRTRLRREKAIEHKLDLERAALFGEPKLDTSSLDNPRRYTGGLLHFIGATNTTDMGGTLTEPELETWMQNVFSHTGASGSRLLLASPLVISALNQMAAGRMQTVPKSDTYGLAITQWITAHGSLNIVKHRLLENGTSGLYGYGGFAIAVDPSKVMFRPLGNRNTKLIENIQLPGDDAWEDEYKTEGGWEVHNASVHGIAKNITG